MALLPGCPEFEYDGHPRRGALGTRIQRILIELRSGRIPLDAISSDTRSAHREMFDDLTPMGFEYYAGNYRGSEFRCLRTYLVGVPYDPRVGAQPGHVAALMRHLSERILQGFEALRSLHVSSALAPEAKLLASLEFACEVFVKFLEIHPYANGNGHAGRLIIWAVLGDHGYWPERWSVEPRPLDPPYTALIKLHRDGIRIPLQRWILGFITGTPPATP